jgi:16S rRNA (adenine1518-N6/adenine1519-N6)-dimethyltransferase
MTLSEMRQHLDKLGMRPSRQLGQNFMYDQNLARKIVELGELEKGQNVLEIGPGLGALTEFILQQSVHLTVIEKDHRLAWFLRTRHKGMEVRNADALDEIDTFATRLSSFAVLGNLPYSVASPLMVRLCEQDLRPMRMVFTIQKEVAERLVAVKQTKDFGLLTLLTQPFYEITINRTVPPTVFWPKPEVESAVVVMRRHEEIAFDNPAHEDKYRETTRRAFQQRRKMLGAVLKNELPEAFRKSRPEDLSVEEWIEVTRTISKNENHDGE